jgi:hypothetical protein
MFNGHGSGSEHKIVIVIIPVQFATMRLFTKKGPFIVKEILKNATGSKF